MRSLITTVVLSLASLANAQTVSLPSELRVQPGRLGSIRIQYDGDDIRWSVPPELDSFREYSPDPRDVRLRVQGFQPGKYQLVAVTCKGAKLSEFAICLITVGDGPQPTPPGPVPPTPTPPGPTPPPTPPGPLPDNPVANRLRDALKKDADEPTSKRENCQALSAFFTAMAGHVKDTGVKTVGDLLADYRAAVPSVLKPLAMPLLRRQIGQEIAELVGSDPAKTIDPDLRDKLVKLFELLAFILKLLV